MNTAAWIVTPLVAILTGYQVIRTPSPDTMTGATVEGIVVAQDSRAPVLGVRVELSPATLGPLPDTRDLPVPPPDRPGVRRFTTDARGIFRGAGIPPGRYIVRLSAEGYSQPKGSGPPEIQLAKDQTLNGLRYELARRGVLRGRITDAVGNPLVGAWTSAVRFVYSDPDVEQAVGKKREVTSGSAKSNDLGEFRIFDLEPGEYAIRFQDVSPGALKVPQYYPGVLAPSDAVLFKLLPGQEIAGIEFRSEQVRLRKIRVKLDIPSTLRLDTPAIRARMVVAERVDRNILTGVISTATAVGENVFEISGLPPGSYLVGYRSMGHSWRLPVEVSDRDVDAGTIQVRVGPPIIGQIRGLNALPAGFFPTNLSVVFRPARNVEMGLRRQPFPVSGDGAIRQFQFSGALADAYRLPPDRYEVEVLGLPPGTYVQSVRYRGQLSTDRTIDFGEEQAPLEITLAAPGGEIDGVVAEADGKLSIGTFVVLVPSLEMRNTAQLFRSQVTDQIGRFRFASIPPGEYIAYASPDIENGAWFAPEVSSPLEGRGTRIQVRAGTKQTLNLRPLRSP